jgi:hypothetical protein
VDPSAKHGNTNSRKEPGTCNWLFQRPEFEEWKTQGSVLWIKGEGEYHQLLFPLPAFLLTKDQLAVENQFSGKESKVTLIKRSNI